MPGKGARCFYIAICSMLWRAIEVTDTQDIVRTQRNNGAENAARTDAGKQPSGKTQEEAQHGRRERSRKERENMPSPKYKHWEEPEQLESIRQWVKQGLTDSKISERMGIDKTLLSKWRRTRPKIRQALIRLVTVDGKQIDKHDTNEGGRKRKLNNVAELEQKINDWIEENRKSKTPLTKSSLCLYLNITKDAYNRYIQQVSDNSTVYQKSELDGELHPVSIADVLKRANLAIESQLEIGMITGRYNVTGAIFDLKNNHGYADKSDINTVNTTKKAVSDDDIDKRIKELQAKAGLHVV